MHSVSRVISFGNYLKIVVEGHEHVKSMKCSQIYRFINFTVFKAVSKVFQPLRGNGMTPVLDINLITFHVAQSAKG